MARRLYAMLPSPGEPIEFALATDKGISLLSASSADIDSSDEIVVFVPATEVGCFDVRLPNQGVTELRRSAAFALEDDLAVAVEDAHVAIGQPLPGGSRPVHIVDPALMEQWVSILNTAGLKTARLVADASVLPATPTAIDTGGRILFSINGRRFAADAQLPDDALKALIQKADAPISVSGSQIAQRLGVADAQSSSLPLLGQLAQWAENGPPLTDLRQGAFVSRRQAEIRIGAWRPALILAAAATVTFLSVIALETHALSRLATALDSQARATYAAAFPGTPIPANLASAVRSQNTAPVANRLPFLEATALLYEAVPVDSGISIQSLRYDRATGRLLANMVYPNYGSDADLKSALEANGIAVSLGDSRQQDGQVLGDITLEAAR
ncbi:type II secretion system protein GspL [Hyphomonas sp.]|jgi:type II secretion system protein L|uniref:type II secretion system protein GspL n=1 Tax=Hyphomonas sp. TaxID=87 RepID=UPI0039E668FF